MSKEKGEGGKEEEPLTYLHRRQAEPEHRRPQTRSQPKDVLRKSIYMPRKIISVVICEGWYKSQCQEDSVVRTDVRSDIPRRSSR